MPWLAQMSLALEGGAHSLARPVQPDACAIFLALLPPLENGWCMALFSPLSSASSHYLSNLPLLLRHNPFPRPCLSLILDSRFDFYLNASSISIANEKTSFCAALFHVPTHPSSPRHCRLEFFHVNLVLSFICSDMSDIIREVSLSLSLSERDYRNKRSTNERGLTPPLFRIIIWCSLTAFIVNVPRGEIECRRGRYKTRRKRTPLLIEASYLADHVPLS